MLVIYFLPFLLLSSVHLLPAEYDAFRRFQPGLEHRENSEGVWNKERDVDEGGLNADSFGRQDVTSDESDGEDIKDHDFDDGKVAQDMAARITIRPQGTYSETYGGFMNMSESYIITYSPHLIAVRSTGPCMYPTDFKESEIDCTTYPKKVVCYQTCMFGYTLEGDDGIQRRMECNKEEDVWRPVHEFEKCKPFVDCGLTIGPGGSYRCRKNFMNKGPDCDISCSAYEDKDPVPSARYQCDINGKWTPELPFCAKGGSPKNNALTLVPAPQGLNYTST